MTPALRLLRIAAEELRKAEINGQWAYFESLLYTIRSLGGRVFRSADTFFQARADYVVVMRKEDALPGALHD